MFERATVTALRASAECARAYAALCDLQAKLIESRINSPIGCVMLPGAITKADRDALERDGVVVLDDRRSKTR